MSNQWQARRGTTAQNDAFTGASGEITYDTDSQGLRVHDGTKQGGYLVDTVVEYQKPTAENNYTWYRLYASGWVEQGGVGTSSLTVILPVVMSDTNYTITVACNIYSASSGTPTAVFYDKATTGFILQGRWNGGAQTGINLCWQVSGMAA